MYRLLALILVLSSTNANFGATPVDSRITAVTVYADRAIATRTASVDIPAAGPLELVFNMLPVSLVPASLQVNGRGTAQVTILDVTARNTYLEYTPNEKVKALEDEIAVLEKQKTALDDRETLLKQQGESLVRVEGSLTAPPSKDTARPTIEELTRLLDFLNDQRTQLANTKASLIAEREKLQARLDALEQQLEELQQQRKRSIKAVTVRLNAATAGKLDLTLSYSLSGASWTPAYDVRLRSEERAVELSYFGQVRNGTGENWQNIDLTLSTARPSLGGGAVDLTPWTVDISQPIAVATKQFMRDEAAKSAQEFAASAERDRFSGNFAGLRSAPAAPVEQEAEMATAAVEAGATSATFRIPGPATLPGDNTSQKIGIASFKLATHLQFEATPKINETFFLHAYATNTSDYPLLAGTMNSFLDGTFVATGKLKTVMVGEKFPVTLGADEGITLKRRLVNRFSEDTGLTSRTKRITYDYLVTATNNKKTAERVVFKDAVPVSRNEKIVVKVLQPAERDTGTLTAPKEITRETDGRYVWRFDLKPGEKREFPFKFSVEYPSDIAVTGLE